MRIPTFALPHRVTITPVKGQSAYGTVYETDPARIKKNVPCRIDPKTRVIRSNNGTDVTQQAQGIFPPDVKLKEGDKIQWTEYGMEFTVSEWWPIDAMGPHSIEVVLT